MSTISMATSSSVAGMDDLAHVYQWGQSYPFNAEQLHYMTIVALKILDKQCEMEEQDDRLFMAIYDGIADRVPSPLNEKVHRIIFLSRTENPIRPKKEYIEVIHELCLIMMKRMDRVTMENFQRFVKNQLPI